MPIDFLRMKGLFGQPSPEFQQATTVQDDPLMSMNQSPMMQPNRGRFNETMDMITNSYPQRGDVSTRGKIGSFLMALGGRTPENIDETVHSKFHNARQSWGDQVGSRLKMHEAEERMANNDINNYFKMLTNDRMIRGQDMTDSRIRDGQAITSARNAATAANAARRNEIYREATRGGQLVFDQSGEGYMVYKDGSKKPLGLSQLSEEEKMRIKHDYDMDLAEFNQRNQNFRDTNTPPLDPNRNNPTALSPSQELAQLRMRATEFLRIYPEMDGKITVDANGVVLDKSVPQDVRQLFEQFLKGEDISGKPEATPPAPSGFGTNNLGIPEINISGGRQQFGASPNVQPPTGGRGNNPSGRPQPPSDQVDGKVTVVNKEGKRARVSQHNLNRAIADGWQVVK